MNFREQEDLEWPTPGSVPFLEVLQSIASEVDFSDVRRFIECGTGETGDNAVHFSKYFETLTIDNDKDLHDRYKNRIQPYKSIDFILGDGCENLESILNSNRGERFVILLDDHNQYVSFIAQELKIIKEFSDRNDHVIIIDDLKFAGLGSYPTVEQVEALAYEINKDYKVKDTKIGQDIYVLYT
jgi:hypothetical protein